MLYLDYSKKTIKEHMQIAFCDIKKDDKLVIFNKQRFS